MDQFEETRTEALLLLRKENEELMKSVLVLRVTNQDLCAEVVRLNYQIDRLSKELELAQDPVRFPNPSPHETI